MFLAGSLPATAHLPLRILGLLGMISRLGPANILHQHGSQVLLNPNGDNVTNSWFANCRIISQQYSLPDPLLILQSPPKHLYWKKLTKSMVLDFWTAKFRGEAEHLDSLQFFNPSYMSLSSPHPFWTSTDSPFEVRKPRRYRTDSLMRPWLLPKSL